MQAILAFTLALVSITNAIPAPQGIGTSSNMCPPGCENEDVFESDNPDPHQVYFFQQMTEPHHCGKNGGCEISKSEVEGKGTSVSASASGAGWISAGFEVVSYSESGEVQTCYGNPEDVICVYWRTAHTMYTVMSQGLKCCQKDGAPSPKVITSPNASGLGSTAICGRNDQCHGVGHSFWNNMEKHNGGVTWAGPAQKWPFGNKLTGLIPDSDEIPDLPKEEQE
ncbi:hypothetical protein F66182_63 [Fusarium sp. NRRL 66182]|nr:hypothetical protein F66182_63 [Fusarium sp. NRRL 66182]